MGTSIRAEIHPDLLVWARENSNMDIEYAAKKIGITSAKLEELERGEEKPTIKQLRKIAACYRVNFAAFFLPSPPPKFINPVKDYRRHHGAVFSEISPEIMMDLRSNLNLREIAIELADELDELPSNFNYSCTINDSVEKIAKNIRNILNIDFSEQKKFREPRIAFNTWRESISNIGILVFQSTKIGLNDMRGYSIFYDIFPIIVVNRKDAYAARTFSLLHEFTHLLLRSSGLCDLHTNTNLPAHEQKIEIFCNKVAAETLVPNEILLKYSTLKSVDKCDWTDELLIPIAKDFGVSREVILRRLLDLGLTTKDFYEKNKERFAQEIIRQKEQSSGGFVPPALDVVSAKGSRFVSLVFDALNSSMITPSDAADYLGVKSKHFGKIESNLSKELE